MKTDRTVSKPVLAITAFGVVLTASILWFGFHSREKRSDPAVAAVVAEQPAAKSGSAPSPAVDLPATGGTEPINGLPPVIPISLTNVLDPAENEIAQADSAMHSLPQGTQVYGGIEFWLQGMIHLQGRATRDDQNKFYRTSVIVPLDETNSPEGADVVTRRGSNIACIYLLVAARFTSQQPGERFADVVWHYADGTTRRSAIQYDVHLRDWTRIPYEQPAQLPNALTRVAWAGPAPKWKDRSLRIYRVAFLNPQPAKVIQSIEFASALTRPSLFVLALTLDPLLPGTRPDNLTSAEMTDPELKGQLQVFVQDTEGRPLANASVSSNFKTESTSASGPKSTTDNAGMALMRFPDSGLQALTVNAEHDDYSGRRMLWDLQTGDTVPASYTLKLAAEVKIGGTVVNAESAPIPGATVSVYRFWRGEDGNPNKKGEQPSFTNQKQTPTDEQGRWQAKGLPAGLLDHIGFDVKHPDFVGTNINVGDNATTEKQLRDGTYKIVLNRGLAVHGRVVDENDVAVSGATVWAGRKYTRDRQQTQSDAQGGFSFHNVTGGDTLFSASAKGRSIDSKTVEVHPGMNDIVFRLKAGNVIRAQVQDESGQPVADARVSLEGSPGDPAYDAYDFSANTDSGGNFSWDSAPAETMPFYVYHKDFEAKRGVKLAPNQDNVVTLHRSRQLHGQVLDADTGQPVTKFTIRTGTASGDGENVYGVIRDRDFGAPDGTFTLSLEEEADNAVAVSADDYADQIQQFPEAQNGTVQVVVRLKPSAGLSGTVVAPDGTPVPGVGVAVSADAMHSNVQLSGGHLRSFGSQNKMAVSDAEGHFKISSTPDDGTVVAAGDPGFGRAPLAEVRSSGTIMLQPWGRIEGALKIGGQPGVGKDLLFNLTIPGIFTDFMGYKSTTDDQGYFTMEKIPPGDGAIVRLIQTAPSSWTHSDSTPVTVKPGETTQVTLGDNGAVLVGRVRFEYPPTNVDALGFEGNLSGQMPSMPAFSTPEESQAYVRTPEFQALMKLHKYYAIEMKPGGSFTVDDVAPCTYSLNVSARLKGRNPWEHPPVAQGFLQATVPDSFSPSSPIDIGEVVLKASPQP